MSLAMTEARYGAGMGGPSGRMRGAYGFGPPAGTTTYGGSGAMAYGGGGGVGTMRIGPGGVIQGDPGLFSFLGKAVRGVAGVVSKLGIPIVSGAAGVAAGLLGGGMRGPGITPTFAPGGLPPLVQQRGTPRGIQRPGILAAGQAFFPGGATGLGEGCGNGTRPNKSGYWLKSGQYVEPGSVCVRRRRMNPLNPRALSKAMRRIESAKRATAVLGRITIRKPC